MQIEAVSVVRWSPTPGAQGASEIQGPDASTLSRLGAHLEFGAPSPAPDAPLAHSLSLSSLEASFKHGMRNSFTTQPMAEMLDAQKRGDVSAMTVALVRVTDAANSVSVLTKMTSSVTNGIKTLTTQSG